jgi:hypothetical protein
MQPAEHGQTACPNRQPKINQAKQVLAVYHVGKGAGGQCE